jgi:Protein of unknown function (DUF3891)
MVLRELGGDSVLCIGQPAHAWLCGQLAREWGNGLFAQPRPRDEVVLAATQHDLGMAAWDAEPQLHPETGWPMSFLEMPLETHLRLWSAAPRLALAQSRWVALLVSMHGAYLYEGRAEKPGVAGFLDTQRQIQSELRASLEVSESDAARLQRLLAAWDWMSLALCRDDLPAAVEAERPIRLERAGEGTVSVAPWPFRGDAFDVTVDARRLDGRFEDEGAMRAALAAARWERLELRVSPG